MHQITTKFRAMVVRFRVIGPPKRPFFTKVECPFSLCIWEWRCFASEYAHTYADKWPCKEWSWLPPIGACGCWCKFDTFPPWTLVCFSPFHSRTQSQAVNYQLTRCVFLYWIFFRDFLTDNHVVRQKETFGYPMSRSGTQHGLVWEWISQQDYIEDP